MLTHGTLPPRASLNLPSEEDSTASDNTSPGPPRTYAFTPATTTARRRSTQAGLLRSSAPPRTVTIRGVRVSAEGAVYLEAQPLTLDLASLPDSAATESGTSPALGAGQGGQNNLQDLGLYAAGTAGGGGGIGEVGGARRRAGEEAEEWDEEEGGGGDAGRKLVRRLLVDDRYQVDNNAWPNRVVGQLTYRKSGGTWICSGGCAWSGGEGYGSMPCRRRGRGKDSKRHGGE